MGPEDRKRAEELFGKRAATPPAVSGISACHAMDEQAPLPPPALDALADADRALKRWVGFTDGELLALYDGLTVDDGTRYGLLPDDEPAYRLAAELLMETTRRGLEFER